MTARRRPTGGARHAAPATGRDGEVILVAPSGTRVRVMHAEAAEALIRSGYKPATD